MSRITGKVAQIIGPVVDVVFNDANTELPKIYDSLEITKKDGTKSLCSYCKTCQNELRVQRKYGLSYKDYMKMLEKQGGCCANKECKATVPGAPGRSRFYIDHCHKTNVIRGLLCHQCNLALGHVNDDIEKLRGLILYLESNKM